MYSKKKKIKKGGMNWSDNNNKNNNNNNKINNKRHKGSFFKKKENNYFESDEYYKLLFKEPTLNDELLSNLLINQALIYFNNEWCNNFTMNEVNEISKKSMISRPKSVTFGSTHHNPNPYKNRNIIVPGSDKNNLVIGELNEKQEQFIRIQNLISSCNNKDELHKNS